MTAVRCPNGHSVTVPADHADCYLAADKRALPTLKRRDPQAARALARSIARREARR